jgi:arylsulfatase A-like enzyme
MKQVSAAPAVSAVVCTARVFSPAASGGERPPNILFAISDDQSWLHAGACGDHCIETPAFDRIARQGVRFNHAYAACGSCTPSRSTILTGQAIWRLKEGGVLWGCVAQ